MQTNEVHRMPVFGGCDRFLPDFAVEHGRGFNCLVDQLRALIENAAGSQSVVPDFRVAHVVVRGKPNRLTVRLKLAVQFGAKELVQSRRLGDVDGVRPVLLADSDSVHNN